MADAASDRRVVSFSIAVPHDGIAHAGGEYYLRHVRALVASGASVTIVAPSSIANEKAASRPLEGVSVLLVPIGAWSRRFGVGGRLRKARLVGPYRRRVLRDRAVARAVRQADVVEFQWTEMADLASGLRRVARRGTQFLAVAHDVVTQSLERFVAQPGAPLHLRVLRRVRLVIGRRDEPRVLNRLDRVITFSLKDRDKLQQVGVRVPVAVVRPSLEPLDARWAEPRGPVDGRVLMVAFFNRQVNVTGLLWFLDEVWPAVRRARPDAQLHVVGAEPPAEVLERADTGAGVDVLGYVADLVPEYQEAAVAIVPLHNGAGVKFKTVTAMLWGVPVVSTTVGVEGIAGPDQWADLFAGVTDDAAEFATAVVSALGDVDASERASVARAFAAGRFSADSFNREIARLYDGGSARAVI